MRTSRATFCAAIALVVVSTAAVIHAAAPIGETPLPTSSTRHTFDLDSGWHSIALDTGAPVPPGVETAAFDDHAWRAVDVPHNWDEYEGFHQVRHGDRHGTAWYRRTFPIAASERGRRIFLFFEGVGSYATVWLNGTRVGEHAGGQTTFTVDITTAAHVGGENLLVVRADHPAGITDLPWVCGGCTFAYGFSEGTQPFGIFRPVHLVTTAPVRIEPFGVHVWNDTDVTPASARVHIDTEVKNYGDSARTVTVVTRVLAPQPALGDAPGRPAEVGRGLPAEPSLGPNLVSETHTTLTLAPGATTTVHQEPPAITNPRLWSPASPRLYSVDSAIVEDATADPATASHHADKSEVADRAAGPSQVRDMIDEIRTPFGIRTVHWPAPKDSDGRLLVNGQPVFLNGVCEYEHNLGASHAFTPEQIRAQVREIEAAGFNAFRDAHTPHNLRWQQYWDADGVLWWPQFGAHIWFDNPAFRANYKALLRQWVKERRNSPSLVLWGLQNESMLPTAFAEECCAIIRKLDPTATTQRKITTCNGGTGTDWDVPQDWSGTYSGNLLDYANDLRREHLVGEYGAWRSLGLHSEGGFEAKGPLSEDRMTALLETKVRLAESVRGEVAGQFMWLFATHSNPGRNVGEHGEQAFDGIRPLDHISPANNKGLFTIWGEPLDAYQMYRGNYAPAATEPMVYIVSHTWPDRWTTPGRKSGIIVYSNCDEVELFNDLGGHSLGRRTRDGRGTHFEWDNVEVTTNILYAEGRVGGKVVARDLVQLHHLPDAPLFAAAEAVQPDLIAPRAGQNYLYRVNCGGPDYVDRDGNRWMADHDLTAGEFEMVGRGVPAEPKRPVAGLGEPGARVNDPGFNGRPGPRPTWGSLSWAAAYPNLSPRFGSQRKTYDPIAGTRDPALFQTYRYGRDELRYVFAVPNGDYAVELYFVEPWYGDVETRAFAVGGVTSPRSPTTSDDGSERGLEHRATADGSAVERDVPIALSPTSPTRTSGSTVSAAGWRLFDVAINGATVAHDVDLWREAGRDVAVKKIFPARVTNGRIEISFPRVAAAQAVISAIAISSSNPRLTVSATEENLITDLCTASGARTTTYTIQHALDTGDQTYRGTAGGFSALPLDLFDADWIQTPAHATAAGLSFTVAGDATAFVAAPKHAIPAWLGSWEKTNEVLATMAAPEVVFEVYRNTFAGGTRVVLGAAGAPRAPMYLTFVEPRRPAPPSQLVREVAGSGWHATGNLTTGRELYADATARITKLPDTLTDCDLLSPSRTSTGGVAFTVAAHVEVYVALDPQITDRPAWLSDWIDTHETITTTNPAAPKYVLLRHRYKPGERVELGSNGTLPSGGPAQMYFAVVRAVRPSVFLEAESASLSEATVVATPAGYTGSGAVSLPPGDGHAIEWTVAVGVGDKYGLDLRFTATTAAGATPALLTIIGADGRVLRTDKLTFPAVAEPGKWTFLRTKTGASINAGTYRFRLTLGGTTPLVVDSLEVE